MEDRCDDPLVATWRAIARAHARLSRALDDALEAQADLPLHSYEVLARLAEADGRRLRMQEVAAVLPLTRSGLTRLVDRLEEAGLVRRESCATDRRGTYAALTPAGSRALRRAGTVFVAVLERHLDGVHADDLDHLRRTCFTIVGVAAAEPAGR